MKKRIILFICLAIGGACLVAGVTLSFLSSSESEVVLSYPYVGMFQDGHIVVSDGENFGYLDSQGKEVTTLKYPVLDSMKSSDGTLDLTSFYYVDGIAPYSENTGKLGLIDASGEIILSARYDALHIISQDFIIAQDVLNYVLINSKGELLNDQMLQGIQEIGELFLVLVDNKYGVMNQHGEFVIDPTYDRMIPFYDEKTDSYLFQVFIGDQSAVYYGTDSFAIVPGLEQISPYSYVNGVLSYTDSAGQYHFYNTTRGQDQSFLNSYVAVSNFHSGLVLAVNGEQLVGYVDAEEQLVIPYQYLMNGTEDFTEEGQAVVETENGIGIIDTTGEIVLPATYQSVEIVKKNRFLVSEDGFTFDLVDQTGKSLLDRSYSSISFDQNYLVVQAEVDGNTTYGVIDLDGNVVVEPNYLQIVVGDHYFLLQEEETKYLLQLF